MFDAIKRRGVLASLAVGVLVLAFAVWLAIPVGPPASSARVYRVNKTAAAPVAARSGPPSPSMSPPTDAEPPTFEFQTLSADEAFKVNQAIPISPLPNPAAKPFAFPDGHEEDHSRAVQCLAQAVYYEAGSESAQGQQAVAQVVLNRVRNPVFPKTVCAVVFQGSERSTGCQFTFTCDGSLGRPPAAAGWAKAQATASRALGGYVEASVGNATHYHTMWVVPYWSPTLLKVARIGSHIFYRWVGATGLPDAFLNAYVGAEPSSSPTAALPASPISESNGLGSQPMQPTDVFASQAPRPSPFRPAPVVPERLEAPTVKPPVTLMAPEVARITEPDRPRTGPSRLAVPSGW